MKTVAFVTRIHPLRSGMLKICADSVKLQTDDDYIHILHKHDETKRGYGKLLANQSFAKVFPINARYVMVLDDDDMLVDPDFVKVLRETITSNPEIVFFRGTIVGRGVYPLPAYWGKRPVLGGIASFCFAIRLDVWKNNIHEFGKRRSGGDFCFIAACYKNTKNHIWLSRMVARTQKRPGGGKGEDEHP